MSATGKSSPYRGVTLFRPTMKWRAQISAFGKTTSLGDHDTEEQAAVAFDRAIIHKSGRAARTNFPLSNYEAEIDELQAMDHVELVATLRSKARKSGQQTSHFRGVSLLKQTNKWHAQINVGGKQVHLGFFPTEEFAARAYDRAAINKGAQEREKGKIVTNFDISDYKEELDLLRRISQEDLIEALSNEGKRKRAGVSSSGPEGRVISGQSRKTPQSKAKAEKDKAALAALYAKAERAQPKSTARNPLYQDFGKKRDTASGSGAGPSRQTSASGSASQQSGPAPRPHARLGRLFVGARLTSLQNGPALALPLIDQSTGAPAAVVPLAPTTQQRAVPTSRTAPSSKPTPQILPRASQPVSNASSTKRSLFPAEITASPRAAVSQVPMPSTPGTSSKKPAAEATSVSDLQALYGPSAFARYAKFLAPSAPVAPGPAKQPAKGSTKPLDAHKAGGRRPGEPQSPQRTAAPLFPPTPPRKRQRTAAKPTGESPPPGAPGVEGLASAQAGKESGRPLQERLRLPLDMTHQQVELGAAASDAALQARPLTKRQEAIAARKQEEAAATLAGARQISPLPDEVGDALMDFAEAAELAELEDKAEQERSSGAHGKIARNLAPKPGRKPALSLGHSLEGDVQASQSDTDTTVTQSDALLPGGEEVGEEQSSRRKQAIAARRIQV